MSIVKATACNYNKSSWQRKIIKPAASVPPCHLFNGFCFEKLHKVLGTFNTVQIFEERSALSFTLPFVTQPFSHFPRCDSQNQPEPAVCSYEETGGCGSASDAGYRWQTGKTKTSFRQVHYWTRKTNDFHGLKKIKWKNKVVLLIVLLIVHSFVYCLSHIENNRQPVWGKWKSN